MPHERIETKPGVLGGKPVIKGTRISVEHILRECSTGQTPEEIVDQYPHITVEDIRAALAYAADYMRQGRSSFAAE